MGEGITSIDLFNYEINVKREDWAIYVQGTHQLALQSVGLMDGEQIALKLKAHDIMEDKHFKIYRFEDFEHCESKSRA